MRKARIKYNWDTNSYIIEINTGEGWEFCCSFPCVIKQNSKTGTADFIHYTFISKMAELQHQGYTLDFKHL